MDGIVFSTQSEYRNSVRLAAFYDDVELTPLNIDNYKDKVRQELTIIRIIEGELTVVIEKNMLTLSDGQAVFINKDVSHSLELTDSSSCHIGMLVFHPSTVFEYSASPMYSGYGSPILGPGAPEYIQFFQKTVLGDAIVTEMEMIRAAIEGSEYGYELVIKGCLCILWNYLLKLLPKSSSRSHSGRNSNDINRVESALFYIDNHYTEQITLDDIADSISVSKSECCRCFNRVLNLTPIEYVMRYRVYAAAGYLQNPSSDIPSMASIATQVGFNNISYFNKIFKRWFGCTPTEFRKRALKR